MCRFVHPIDFLHSCITENSLAGHVYHQVIVDKSWDDAKSDALALTYKGVHGNLVSIRSQAEQTFLTSQLHFSHALFTVCSSFVGWPLLDWSE